MIPSNRNHSAGLIEISSVKKANNKSRFVTYFRPLKALPPGLSSTLTVMIQTELRKLHFCGFTLAFSFLNVINPLQPGVVYLFTLKVSEKLKVF